VVNCNNFLLAITQYLLYILGSAFITVIIIIVAVVVTSLIPKRRLILFLSHTGVGLFFM